MHFEHIAIVGVGLIGGSFALAARRAGMADRITGFDNLEVLEEARKRDMIDGAEEAFLSQDVSDADFVYLAAPVGGILSFLRTRGSLLKPGSIVTDAGSTKREICRTAQQTLPAGVAFVGGHPMAGSEKTGVEFASAELFRDSPYAVIADEYTDSNAFGAVREVAKMIGAMPIELKAEQHDRIVARVSHTPQMLATALALAASRTGDTDSLKTAGPGFAEMTRLAESRWSLWEDICRTNADEIEGALDETIREIEAVRAAISSGDFSGLGEMFQTAGELVRRFRSVRRKI